MWILCIVLFLLIAFSDELNFSENIFWGIVVAFIVCLGIDGFYFQHLLSVIFFIFFVVAFFWMNPGPGSFWR